MSTNVAVRVTEHEHVWWRQERDDADLSVFRRSGPGSLGGLRRAGPGPRLQHESPLAGLEVRRRGWRP